MAETTATVATETENAAPKLFRKEKRKVRDKDLMVGVWYESDGTNQTAFVGKVLDLDDNELFSLRVAGEKFDAKDDDTKLGYDAKAFKAAKAAAAKFANEFGREPSEQETVVAELKRLREELTAEFDQEKLNELLGLIEKLAA